MKIPKIKKKVSKTDEKVSIKNTEKSANNNANLHCKNPIPEPDEIRPFPFEKEGFEVVWNASKNHFVVFIDPEIYDLPIPTMYELNEKLADLFFEFYLEQKTKIAKKTHEETKFANFIDRS